METLMNSLAADVSNNHRVGQWMELLVGLDLWQDLWHPTTSLEGFKIGILLVRHVMALESPIPSTGSCYDDCVRKLWEVKAALTSNSVVCEMMEDMWTELPLMAALVSGSTIRHLAVNLHGVHPNIITPGFRNFLQMKQLHLLAANNCEEQNIVLQDTIYQAACQFVDLVNVVKHLDLDAGHWHELWERGEPIGLCIILHYIKHEKRTRLEQLGRIRNINACINSNIRKIRDALATSPDLVDELIALWQHRADIAKHIDGDTLRVLASDLGSDIARVKLCFDHLCSKLPENWGDAHGHAQKPTAYLYTCVHNFIHQADGHRMHTRHSPNSSPRSIASSHGSPKAVTPRSPAAPHAMWQDAVLYPRRSGFRPSMPAAAPLVSSGWSHSDQSAVTIPFQPMQHKATVMATTQQLPPLLSQNTPFSQEPSYSPLSVTANSPFSSEHSFSAQGSPFDTEARFAPLAANTPSQVLRGGHNVGRHALEWPSQWQGGNIVAITA